MSVLLRNGLNLVARPIGDGKSCQISRADRFPVGVIVSGKPCLVRAGNHAQGLRFGGTAGNFSAVCRAIARLLEGNRTIPFALLCLRFPAVLPCDASLDLLNSLHVSLACAPG